MGKKKQKTDFISMILDSAKSANNTELRKTIALEKIARCLADISHCLLAITDGNDKTIRTKDVGRVNQHS